MDFQKERFNLLEMPEFQNQSQLAIDELAWKKAQDTWERAYKEAAITGTYNGQPTTEWLATQAQLTGVLNGQQTLQGKLTDAQIAQMNQQMKLANDEFLANTTGYYNGTKTFDREKFEASQASDAWKFLSTLTGPKNAFTQLRALGSMPQGLRDLAAAWGGQYMVGGLTGGGQPTQRITPADLLYPTSQSYQWGQPASGYAPQPTQPAAMPGTPYAAYDVAQQPAPPVAAPTPVEAVQPVATIPPYSVNPVGQQAPVAAWNYQPTPTGQTNIYPPGTTAPADQAQVSTVTPVSHADAGSMVAMAYNPMAYGTSGTGQFLPNQINAKNYGNTNEYAQQLGWAAFEDQGWDVGAAQDAFKKSLPRYGGPTQGSFGGF